MFCHSIAACLIAKYFFSFYGVDTGKREIAKACKLVLPGMTYLVIFQLSCVQA